MASDAVTITTLADPPHQYKKLTEPDALRLVLLSPSRDLQSPVECDLISTTLSNCENDLIDHYTALSYVWGDPSQRAFIKVAGQPLSITASLDTALRHLRDPSRPRRIWADAICINQNDFEERNQQVRQMASVYAIAQHTVIWIGEGTAETDELFTALKHLASQRLLGRSTVAPQMMEVSKQVRLSASQTILARQWFTRVWVLQELVRSRDPWVQCGTFIVKWNDLKSIIAVTAQEIGTEKVHLIEDMARLHSEYHLSRFRHLSGYDFEDPMRVAGRLLTLLTSRRALGVQDPRDRLFAHVGLLGSVNLDETLLQLIEVDYGKEESLVFFEIARFLTESFQDYRVLSLLERGHATNSTHLASWVPDWSVENPPMFETLSSALNLEDQTSATYFPPNPRCLNFWVPESCVLVSGGWLVAKIRNASEVDVSSRSTKSSALFESMQKEVLNNPKYHCKVKELLSLLATGFIESYEKWQQALQDNDTPNPLKVFTDFESQFGKLEEPYDPQSFLKTSRLFGSTAEIDQAEESLRHGIQATCDYLTEELLPQKQLALFGGPQSTRKIEKFKFETQSLLAHLTMLGFGNEVKNMFCFRKLAILEDGTPALVPESTKSGDVVAILMRHAIPIILRPIEVEEPSLEENIRSQIVKDGYHYLKRKKIEHFAVVGECFVEGLMYGEAYKRYKWVLSRQPRVLALH